MFLGDGYLPGFHVLAHSIFETKNDVVDTPDVSEDAKNKMIKNRYYS